MTRRQMMMATLAAMGVRPALAVPPDLHYIMAIGQSLILGGDGTPALSTTQPYANKTVDSGGFHDLIADSCIGCGSSPPYQEDPPVSMANQFTSLAGGSGQYDIVIGRAGVGGTAYSGIKKGTTPYNDSLTNAGLMPSKSSAVGKTYEFSALLCFHGETDASSGQTGAQYAANLLEWRTDYSADLRAISGQAFDLPLFTDQMYNWNRGGAPYASEHPTYAPTGADGVGLAQYTAMRDNPGKIYCVLPLYGYPYASGSGVHLSNAGYRRAGEVCGMWMKRVMVDGLRYTGLCPRSITVDGAYVYCRFWLYPGRSLVIDSTTLSDQGAGKGFEVYDATADANLTISSVSVNSDVATIQLSAPVTGGNLIRLRTAYTATLSAGGGTSGQAHTNIRDNESTVGQGSGLALVNWALGFDEPNGFSWGPPPGAATTGAVTFTGAIQ